MGTVSSFCGSGFHTGEGDSGRNPPRSSVSSGGLFAAKPTSGSLAHSLTGSLAKRQIAGGLALWIGAALLLASPLSAAKVSTWRHATEADFRKTSLDRSVVTSEGRVKLARRLDSLAKVESSYVWDLAEDDAGKLYLAVADPGKVLRLEPDGSFTTLWDSPDRQAFCVAARGEGVVYVGTGPEGKVWKVSGGSAEVLFDAPAEYIWDLALDAAGNLFVATGPEGQIFRIGTDGEARLFYDAKQRHVLCLALGDDGTVYAGTGDGGLIYRISPEGKAFVLYETEQDEVRCLLLTEAGVLYAGTGAAGSSNRTASASSSRRNSSEASASREASSSSPASRRSAQNALYRINPDGAVRKVFQDNVLFFSLLEQPGQILAATGTSGGVVYSADRETGERSQYARVESEQVLCLLERKNGVVVFGTGNPGGLFALSPGYCPSGTATSPVFDAEMVSRWGAVRWDTAVPDGTSVSLALRSGNVEEPDETWSGWSSEMTEPESASIPCPAARFLQYRATLKSADPNRSPELRSVTLRYRTTNQPPEITEIEVPHVDQADGTKRQEKYKLTWKAEDANKDTLHYRVCFRKEGWKSWIDLADDLTKAEHEWDTTAVPEGNYVVQVTASDAEDNPPTDARTATRASETFLIDHSPPSITVKVTGTTDGQAELNIEVKDTLTRLTRASYSLDSGKWHNLFPADGLFDTTQEAFQFRTDRLKPGTHVIVVQGVDAAGNIGSADAVFETK